MIGKTLAHFEIVQKIGAGGMGEVYRARDTKLDRDVALKILPPEFASDPNRSRRFTTEARAVAALNHPNIVTIYSIEEADDAHFLTMELIRGVALDEAMPENGFSEVRFLDLALPITDALSSAHEVGVVHRDLKPSNLMVGEDDRVKILDFGLATFVRSEPVPDPGQLDATIEHDRTTGQQLTAEGVIMGTAPYMSPEQIEGKPVDARSDIFSLGIVLYEMVTGRRPFHGDSGPALISSILKDVPPPVTHHYPNLSPDLARIIGRCLEKEPKRRFQTARDVNNELESVRAAAATGSAPADDGPVYDPTAGVVAGSEGGPFTHDLFISYAQLDNEAQFAGQQGWVSAFHRSLEVRVGQLVGKKPNIWRSPKHHGDTIPHADQIEHIPRSALLITVLSPRYVKSEWCNRELKEFLNSVGQTGGPHWGSRYRVLKVVKTPTPVDRHPPEIQLLSGYEFFKIDPETGRHRELDQIFGPEAQRDYWARLDDLAHDIAELLERADGGAGAEIGGSDPESQAASGDSWRAAGSDSGAALADGTGRASPGTDTGAIKGRIYLATTSYDLRDEHDALRRDLTRHGYATLPGGPLPLVEDELRRAVDEDLSRASLSVHLVGRNYGVVPEGATASVVELQNQIASARAAAHGLRQLIWIPAGLEITDERQRDFVQRLRNDPDLHHGADLLETPLEDLKTVIHQTLNPPARASEPRSAEGNGEDADATHVYLICDQRDQEETDPIADFLFENGFEVTLPVFEGNESEVREDHEESLRVCDAVLVYYGAGNELWLRRKLREVQKSAGFGRKRAMRAKGIWIAPPVTPQKTRIRTREALIMTQGETFAPEPLQPFISVLT